MWELDHKESWAPKNWCFWIVMLGKTLESPLDIKKINPVNPKGNQSWIVIERTDAKAEAPILRAPDVNSQLTGKDPDAGKDWRQEEKGTAEDEMAGWHHWLNGHEFEQALGVGAGEGSLACCSPWGHKESDMSWQLNKVGEITSHLSEFLLSTGQEVTNAGEGVEKRVPSCTVGGNVDWCSHCGEQGGGSSKT